MDNCNISPNTIYKLTEVLKYISGVEIYRLYTISSGKFNSCLKKNRSKTWYKNYSIQTKIF